MCLLLKEWLPSGHYHKGRIGGVLQRWEKLPEGQPAPQRNWSHVASLIKALLPWLLSLAERPAPWRVLVVPNFLHLRMEEAHVFFGTFNAAEMIWYPSPDLCLDAIPPECYGQFLRSPGLVFALTCTVNCGTLHRQVCLSKSWPIHLHLQKGWLQSYCRNIKDDQWKQDASELNFQSHSKGSENICQYSSLSPNLRFLVTSGQKTDFHRSNVHILVFLSPSKSLIQHAVSSEQLMCLLLELWSIYLGCNFSGW
jgi:hypothetical protein